MTSERRAAAARANGAKSRGPVTAQGKANSARNSFRHGLRARLLFNDGKFEPEREAILAGLTAEFKPESEIESRLVEIIADARWAQNRLWQLEAELLNAEMRRLNSTAVAAFRSLADHTCALELLARFESRYSRLYDRALVRLHRLQCARIPRSKNTWIDERTHQVIENKAAASGQSQPDPSSRTPDQRHVVSVRQSFVARSTEIPAKCA